MILLSEGEQQSFDNILQDVSQILPSVNSQTYHNTIESSTSFNPPLAINNCASHPL